MPSIAFSYYNKVGTVVSTMRTTNIMLWNTVGLTCNLLLLVYY